MFTFDLKKCTWIVGKKLSILGDQVEPWYYSDGNSEHVAHA